MTAVDIPAMTPPRSSSASASASASRDPKICPTDDEAIVPKGEERNRLNKQSWEYIIKTGVAGGLAGCAVCSVFPWGTPMC
jgi:solute carrier family 25 (mitochondrial carrier protein), member 16